MADKDETRQRLVGMLTAAESVDLVRRLAEVMLESQLNDEKFDRALIETLAWSRQMDRDARETTSDDGPGYVNVDGMSVAVTSA